MKGGRMDAQFHKKKHYKLEAGFSCAPPGLNFLSDLYPGPRPGSMLIPPPAALAYGHKRGILPLMRSVTYLMVCSLPSSGYPSFSAPSSLAASPGLHIPRNRNFTPSLTNYAYGYVRICTESLLYPGTKIIHPDKQITARGK